MKVLFVGDIVGKPGRQAVATLLPSLQRKYEVLLTIANAENAAGGFGITPSAAEELFRADIDLLTSGNHIWDKKEVELYIATERRLLRPANYPEAVPGSGVALWEQGGRRVGVLNLQGRVFMPTLACPFQVGEEKIATPEPGNHIWDKKEAELYIATERRLLRPANYPEAVPGSGVALWEQGGRRVGVLNLQGRVFMPTLACPFQVGEEKIALLKQATDLIIIDFHAEATSEKQAFARFVDGRVSAVLGTHTHVQTADEQILPAGTAYISDVGMTGASDSIIGMESSDVIYRFLTQMPSRFRVAKGAPILSAVVLDLDEESGKAKAITRLQLREEWGGGE